MTKPESASAEAENKHHDYLGSQIPWYIHLLWVSFWILAIYYVVTFLFPAFRTEIVSPP